MIIRALACPVCALLLAASCDRPSGGTGREEEPLAAVATGPDEARVGPDEIDATVRQLGSELKEALLAALGEGGPADAIGVCRDKAPEVAAAHAERTGWTIRRSALRVRNPQNAPDDWERRQLEAFAKRIAEGADPATLTTFEVVGDQRRFARAIPTGAECLICHGPAVDDDTSAAIARLYPDDRATGFQLGELRGIFSVTVAQD